MRWGYYCCLEAARVRTLMEAEGAAERIALAAERIVAPVVMTSSMMRQWRFSSSSGWVTLILPCMLAARSMAFLRVWVEWGSAFRLSAIFIPVMSLIPIAIISLWL